LKSLKKVELDISHDSRDFTIVFTFGENEYFTNTELRKKFVMPKGDDEEDFPIKTIGTAIVWKDKKNITKKTI